MSETPEKQLVTDLLELLQCLSISESNPTLKRIAEMQTVIALNNCESGATIPEVMANIRHQPYEIITVFDNRQRKFCDRTIYDKWMSSLYLTDDVKRLADTAIHNHITDCTFSAVDLRFIEQLNLKTSILVTPSYNYYLERPEQGWPQNSDWCEELASIGKSLYYTSRLNLNRATARHQALIRVSERYNMPYYQTDSSGNLLVCNSLYVNASA